MLLGYLLLLAYFGFRPFEPIPGKLYHDAAPATNGFFRVGAALEDAAGAAVLLGHLVESGRMSLEILLKTDSLRQGGPARIISFSRDSMSRNFTLGQSGNGLSFRLRTTETDANGMYPSLLVPRVFDEQRFQHLAVVYDGKRVQLYVDGKLRPETIELHGDFDNWSRSHVLVLGDEVPGGRPWTGTVESLSIYDRALTAKEVALLGEGKPVPGAVYAFRVIEKGGGEMHPLKYRNPFAFSDSVFSRSDCIANVVGFIPVAALLWFSVAWSSKWKRFTVVFLLPMLFGLLASVAIELGQRYIKGRVPCGLDLVYNLLGTVFGCSLLWLMMLMCRRRKRVDRKA